MTVSSNGQDSSNQNRELLHSLLNQMYSDLGAIADMLIVFYWGLNGIKKPEQITCEQLTQMQEELPRIGKLQFGLRNQRELLNTLLHTAENSCSNGNNDKI
jgi:hypothetical protein